MICPTCGTHIPDGMVRCPACHAGLVLTQAMPALQGRWCTSCGASVPWEAQVCPHCGLPVADSWPKPQDGETQATDEALEADDQEELAQDATDVLPRIESAIPSSDDPTSKVAVQDEMPRTGRVALASVFAVALVVGLTLFLTHPWNPDAHSIKATTEADTSTAGFPGTVDSLTGQDGRPEQGEPVSGDEATYAQLAEAHERLGRLAARADQSQEQLGETEQDTPAWQEHKHEADLLAIDASNLVASLEHVDVTSGTYATELDHLLSLANWLRNRVDALVGLWSLPAESAASEDEDQDEQDPAASAEALRQDEASFRRLFEERYELWAPEQAAGDDAGQEP